MNERRTWSELEPHEWGGSLAAIERAETEVLRSYQQSTEKAGTYWISSTTDLFRFACPAEHITAFMAERLLEYAELVRVSRFGPAEFDEARAAQRLFSAMYSGVKANAEEIYSLGGQRLTAILYYLMTQNIRNCYGSCGAMLVFSDLGQVWAEFLRHFGSQAFDALLSNAITSIIRLLTYSVVRRLALHWRPQSALDWILGISENPAYFLVSEMQLAAYRCDEPWLETFTTSDQYLNLPSLYSPRLDPKIKFRPQRVTGDYDDWYMRYAVAEVLITTPWPAKDQPFAFIAECSRNLMRARIRKDEVDHIAAGRKGIGLVVLDSSAEVLRSPETDGMSVVEDIPSIFDLCNLDPDIRDIYRLRAKGVKWKDMAVQLSWPKKRAEAARARLMRAKPKLRKAIVKRGQLPGNR